MNAIAKTARRAARVVSAPVAETPVAETPVAETPVAETPAAPANPFIGLSDMPELENAVYEAARASDVAERTFNALGPQLRAELRALKVGEEWASESDASKTQKEAQAKIARSFKTAYITSRAIAAEPLFAAAENPIAAARAAVVKWVGEKNDATRPAWWRKADTGARAMLSRALFAEGLKTVEARGGNRKAETPKAETPKAETPKAETPAFERIEAVDIIAAATATFGPSCAAFLAKLEESGAKPDARSKPIVSAIKSLALLLQKANEAK